MRLTINVTQEAIDYAQPLKRGDCAIALAIREIDDSRYGWPAIDRDRIRVSDRVTRKRYVWDTPRDVQQFIDGFDSTRGKWKARPFRFTLDTDDCTNTHPMKRENLAVHVARTNTVTRPTASVAKTSTKGTFKSVTAQSTGHAKVATKSTESSKPRKRPSLRQRYYQRENQ